MAPGHCSQSTLRSIEPWNGNDDAVQDILDELHPVVPGEENTRVNVNFGAHSETDGWGHALEANWDIGDFTLTSITAYRESSVEAYGDTDARPTNPLGFDQRGATEQDQWTQEFRLTSPIGEKFNYVLGFFYFDQTVSRQFRRSFEIIDGNPGIGIATFSVDTKNWAAFGEGTYTLNDRWRLRYRW